MLLTSDMTSNFVFSAIFLTLCFLRSKTQFTTDITSKVRIVLKKYVEVDIYWENLFPDEKWREFWNGSQCRKTQKWGPFGLFNYPVCCRPNFDPLGSENWKHQKELQQPTVSLLLLIKLSSVPQHQKYPEVILKTRKTVLLNRKLVWKTFLKKYLQ